MSDEVVISLGSFGIIVAVVVGIIAALRLRRRRRMGGSAMEANHTQATDQGQGIREIEAKLRLETRVKNGANWFYWIAGLSLINSVIVMAGGGWSFVIGLGLTQLVDAIAGIIAEDIGSDAGMVVQVVAFVIDIVIAGIFTVFGVFARKRHQWAFIVGMVLYALDGLLLLWAGDYLSVGFHLFPLGGIYGGVKSLGQLAKLEESEGTVAQPSSLVEV